MAVAFTEVKSVSFFIFEFFLISVLLVLSAFHCFSVELPAVPGESHAAGGPKRKDSPSEPLALRGALSVEDTLTDALWSLDNTFTETRRINVFLGNRAMGKVYG